MALHDLPEFDPGIIERYVENTYRKANAVFLGSVVAGVMIGAAFGATPLTSLGANWPIPRMFGFATMILGAIVGGAIGYLIGDTRSFLARLQGQTALAQIQAAKDARMALEAVQQIQALATRRVAAAKPAAAPAVAPPPPVTPPPAEPEPVAASVAVEPTPAPVAPVELASVPAPPPVELVPPPLVAPVGVTPAPTPVEAAAVEAVPPPPALELAQPPAPPTLVVAAASPEPAPPLTPPLSS
jgi:hypothetical protein